MFQHTSHEYIINSIASLHVMIHYSRNVSNLGKMVAVKLAINEIQQVKIVAAG